MRIFHRFTVLVHKYYTKI